MQVGSDHSLVTSDGLQLDDTSGTIVLIIIVKMQLKLCYVLYKGLKFWKVGSRKLYAERHLEMKDSKRRSTAQDVIHVSSSDSDDELVKPLIRCKHTAEAAKLAVMSNNIKQMKESVSNSMSIPLGLRQLLYDTF